jgi:hypothetical protein
VAFPRFSPWLQLSISVLGPPNALRFQPPLALEILGFAPRLEVFWLSKYPFMTLFNIIWAFLCSYWKAIPLFVSPLQLRSRPICLWLACSPCTTFHVHRCPTGSSSMCDKQPHAANQFHALNRILPPVEVSERLCWLFSDVDSRRETFHPLFLSVFATGYQTLRSHRNFTDSSHLSRHSMPATAHSS